MTRLSDADKRYIIELTRRIWYTSGLPLPKLKIKFVNERSSTQACCDPKFQIDESGNPIDVRFTSRC